MMATRAFHLALAMLAIAFAGVWAHATTPLPAREDKSVYDLAGLIDANDVASMEGLHRELLQKAGVAMVVVTIPQLEDETIDEFALRVGELWGVGQKGIDRGIVVALSALERDLFVATGYGVESFLPDGRVGRMIDDYAMPSFRKNEPGQGLRLLSAGLAGACAEEAGVTLSGMPRLPEPLAPTVLSVRRVLVGLVMACVFLYLAWRHPRLLFFLFLASRHRGPWGGGGFGGGTGFGGFGGGGFGGGGAGRGY